MKKTSILIAMFAVIAAASTAKAEITDINFDGKFKPQSMHDIFAGSHQLIPAPTPVPPPSKAMIDPSQGACAMVCFPGNPTMVNDPATSCCGFQPATPSWCMEEEIAPGFTMPVCYSGPIIPGGSVLDTLRTAGAALRTGFPVYSAEHPGFADSFRKAASDKNAKILYNGKTFSLAKRPAGRWHSDESLAAHSDYTENHPETHGHIEVAIPAHTLTDGTMGAASGTLAGALMGAAYGFWQDVNDYANGRN